MIGAEMRLEQLRFTYQDAPPSPGRDAYLCLVFALRIITRESGWFRKGAPHAKPSR